VKRLVRYARRIEMDELIAKKNSKIIDGKVPK
jgi:hypothetical protein